MLRANLSRLKQSARVIRSDALRFVGEDAARYDVAFLDPPFGAGVWTAVAQALEAHARLQPGAWVYVESPADAEMELPANWQQHRESRAGAVRFALYRRTEPSAKL